MSFPRTYTVQEICLMMEDVMRIVEGSRVEIQPLLRTFMMNGTDPLDLRLEAERTMEMRRQRQEEYRLRVEALSK